jgi:hypothetical protein
MYLVCDVASWDPIEVLREWDKVLFSVLFVGIINVVPETVPLYNVHCPA